jgi:hypothetical protein
MLRRGVCHTHRGTRVTCLQSTELPPGSQVGPTPPGQRFNYLFYVDFIGSLTDVRCQNALRHLQVSGWLGEMPGWLSDGPG